MNSTLSTKKCTKFKKINTVVGQSLLFSFCDTVSNRSFPRLYERYLSEERARNRTASKNFTCQMRRGAYNSPAMTRKGGINKTRKAVAKRFKVTGTGKVLRRKQGKRHILQKKSSKRKRALGKPALVDDTQVWAIKQNMPFA